MKKKPAVFEGPQPGPQMMLAESTADIAILGGGAGGGKSTMMLYESVKLTALEHVRAMKAVVFRREERDLKGGGGIWDASFRMFPLLGGKPRTTPSLDWTFEASTRRVEDRHRVDFRGLQLDTSIYAFDGTEYDVIVFDELQQFTARQFWYMLTKLRGRCGVRPRCRASCNPLAESWLAELIEWWIGDDGYALRERSGAVRWFVRDAQDDTLAWFDSRSDALAAYPGSDPMSLTFIVSTLEDNAKGDPTYRGRLAAQPRAERMRLLGDRDEDGHDRGGNWLRNDSAGDVFKRDAFKIIDAPPSHVVQTVRFWDRAASSPTAKHPNPDWTRGVRMSLCAGGEIYVDDLVSERAGPTEINKLVRRTAENDGVAVEVGLFQDAAAAGKTDVETMREALAGFSVEIISSMVAGSGDLPKPVKGSSRAKRVLANAWAPAVEAGKVHLLRAAWNGVLLNECDAFPFGQFDDIVDAMSGAFQVLKTRPKWVGRELRRVGELDSNRMVGLGSAMESGNGMRGL